MTVIDVGEQDFAREVLERSRTTPVVVDFWAEWCGPCRELGPLLEAAASEREGEVVLAKLDVDANPRLAQDFQIRGIPAVKAFADERVAAEFVGALPRAEVERFFDALVPSQADALVAAGGEEDLRQALGLEPGRRDATVALARMLLARGEREEARALLAGVPGDFQAEGLDARIRLQDSGALEDAFAALDDGDVRGGLEQLLAALGEGDGTGEDVRRVIVGELDALGPESDLAREARRRLATSLY